MLNTLSDTLQAAGIDEQPAPVLADAGYCSKANFEAADPDGPDLLVATTKRHKLDAATDDNDHDGDPVDDEELSRVEEMAHKLACDDDARTAYDQRGWMIEGVFGQVKQARGIRRLPRRGLHAARADWLLTLACHNLVKLWRHTRCQPPGGGPDAGGGLDHPTDDGLALAA